MDSRQQLEHEQMEAELRADYHEAKRGKIIARLR
eukprot:COSAG06_NODE_58504_length_277_cov_0.398876_1_plen_33_part_10